MIKRFRKSKGKYLSKASQDIIVVSLIIVLSFLIVSDFKLLHKKIKTGDQVKILQEKVNDLTGINDDLKNKLNASFNEEYIEKVLREKGIYKKPNEEAVVIIPSNQGVSSSASVTSKQGKNFWQRILDYIKELFHRSHTKVQDQNNKY